MMHRAGVVVGLLVSVLLAASVEAQKKDQEVGLHFKKDGVQDGYNLFSPLDAGTTYLMDNDGRVLHTWESEYRPANQPYLMPNGNLIRPFGFGLTGNRTFRGGGAGYGIEEFTWDGERVWYFEFASDQYLMHHDIEPMPNGNILILAWEMKSREEAIAAGRDPELLKQDELWPEHVLEIKPTYPEGGEIVWEWHLWDHLVQDFDETKANYGDVAAHPELVELNPTGHWLDRISDEELEQLEALGYLGGDEEEDDADRKKRRGGTGADWHHANGIDYNAELDQITISSLGNNEIWIIDHSTTTEEAKGHTGGRAGKGGDLLYRWGNPIAYRAGLEEDQQLFVQHDVHWIEKGKPGEGNLLIFNNGRGRPDGNYSSVVELKPPLNGDGGYVIEPGQAFAPASPTWQYMAEEKKDFYSNFISGSQRQPNGNTLICSGATGTFIEVTPEGEAVWWYVNPAVPPQPVAETDDKKKKKKKKDEKKARPQRKFSNIVFRIYRYQSDYAAFEGKGLKPGPLLTDYVKDHPAITPMELDQKEAGAE